MTDVFKGLNQIKDLNFIYNHLSCSSCKLHFQYAWKVLGRKLNHESYSSVHCIGLWSSDRIVYTTFPSASLLLILGGTGGKKTHLFNPETNRQTNQPFQKNIGSWISEKRQCLICIITEQLGLWCSFQDSWQKCAGRTMPGCIKPFG